MKFLLLCFIAFVQVSFAQTGNKIYIREIGWTIIMPKNFKVQKKANVQNSSPDNVPDSTGKIVLIKAISHNVNYFQASYYVSPEINSNNWEINDSAKRASLLKAFEGSLHAGSKTTSSGTTTIDGVSFKKNQTDFVTGYNRVIQVIFLSAFYKNHYLLISANFADNDEKNDIINMVNSSTFDK